MTEQPSSISTNASETKNQGIKPGHTPWIIMVALLVSLTFIDLDAPLLRSLRVWLTLPFPEWLTAPFPLGHKQSHLPAVALDVPYVIRYDASGNNTGSWIAIPGTMLVNSNGNIFAFTEAGTSNRITVRGTYSITYLHEYKDSL